MSDPEVMIGERAEVLERLRGVLVERMRLDRTRDQIDASAPLFGAGFALDSLDAVELVVCLDTMFGIDLPDVELRPYLRSLDTVADLVISHRRGALAGGAEQAPSLAGDAAAVRTSVALSESTHLTCLRVAGADAHALLDRISPRELFVRSGQMLHTLFLDDHALPIADVYICAADDNYLVIADGVDVLGLLARHAAGLAVEVTDLTTTHAMLSLDGPFAWELVAELTSPDVIGIPYLGFFETDRFTCFRAGKTGEYGYDLLVPRAHLSAVREQILDVGRAFELRVASRDTIDLCALEAGFFNVRHEVRPGMTPVELQLQWRVTAGRVPGLARHRPTQRCVTFAAPGPLVPDADVELAGAGVGRVLHARFSPTRGEYLGIALVDIGVAYAGLRGFRAGETPLRTIASPAVNNRSLYVDPQRHTFSSRDTTAWPPLVRGVP